MSLKDVLGRIVQVEKTAIFSFMAQQGVSRVETNRLGQVSWREGVRGFSFLAKPGQPGVGNRFQQVEGGANFWTEYRGVGNRSTGVSRVIKINPWER